jgi:hypothetical protein
LPNSYLGENNVRENQEIQKIGLRAGKIKWIFFSELPEPVPGAR